MIEQGLTAIRAQFAAEGSADCLQCGEPIAERRRQLLPNVTTCISCQERKEFQQKVGNVVAWDCEAD